MASALDYFYTVTTANTQPWNTQCWNHCSCGIVCVPHTHFTYYCVTHPPAPEWTSFQRKELISHTAEQKKNPPMQQYLKHGFMVLRQLIFLKWFKGMNASKSPALSCSAMATWSQTSSALNNPVFCGQPFVADLVCNGRDEGYFFIT